MDAATTAFLQAKLYTDDVSYCLIHLPAPAITPAAVVLAEIGMSFSALIVDKDEVTLLLPFDDWKDFQHRLPGHQEQGPYRLITFDLPLDLNLLGFMALVSRILADAQVPILALSAFERDHLLIPADRFQTAWDALSNAQIKLAGN
ncbi:MAG: ACT domain-containing protein [Chloroflexi bacterium]|nr:ACT domain-containing protein [Chloroflexota bacterium]